MKQAAKKVPAKKAAPRKKNQTKAKVRTVGRPSSYRPEFSDQAYKLCLLGATDRKMADFFRVSEDTLHEWKKVYPEFSESMARGKERADAEIAESLFHRAKGYSHPEVDIRVVDRAIVKTPLTKHYPPDTQAASLWLRNRQPKLWRDKVDVEHAGPGGGAIKSESTVTLEAGEAYLRMIGGA